MEPQLWFKVQEQERWVDILMLRGQEVHLVTVCSDLKGLKPKLTAAMQALQSGQDPNSLKADWVKSLSAPAIAKAEVSPGNDKLTLYHGAKGAKKLIYSTGDNDAGAILQEILAQSGKTFQPVEVEIGVVEALVAPVVIGVMAMAVLVLVYGTAGKLAAGQPLEAQGTGRIGAFMRMLIWAAELLGLKGTLAAGVVVLILIVAWGARSLTHRPRRTVWLPAQS